MLKEFAKAIAYVISGGAAVTATLYCATGAIEALQNVADLASAETETPKQAVNE